MEGAKYTAVVKNLLEAAENLRLSFTSQQGNGKKRKARATVEWTRSKLICVLEWPSQSLVLNHT